MAPLSMGFSRQEYWSGLPFSSPGGLPDPGSEPRSPALQAGSLPSGTPGKPKVNVKSNRGPTNLQSQANNLFFAVTQELGKF